TLSTAVSEPGWTSTGPAARSTTSVSRSTSPATHADIRHPHTRTRSNMMRTSAHDCSRRRARRGDPVLRRPAGPASVGTGDATETSLHLSRVSSPDVASSSESLKLLVAGETWPLHCGRSHSSLSSIVLAMDERVAANLTHWNELARIHERPSDYYDV